MLVQLGVNPPVIPSQQLQRLHIPPKKEENGIGQFSIPNSFSTKEEKKKRLSTGGAKKR
jgi:hypothetical protein